jgi:hypothetical protein
MAPPRLTPITAASKLLFFSARVWMVSQATDFVLLGQSLDGFSSDRLLVDQIFNAQILDLRRSDLVLIGDIGSPQIRLGVDRCWYLE